MLTAWRKIIEINNCDPQAAVAFLAEYVGNGSENEGTEE
jgi:hypothetical protein